MQEGSGKQAQKPQVHAMLWPFLSPLETGSPYVAQVCIEQLPIPRPQPPLLTVNTPTLLRAAATFYQTTTLLYAL